MGRDDVFRPSNGKETELYGMSEYLMIAHELEKARLAPGAEGAPERGAFYDRRPAVRERRETYPPTNSKEVAWRP